MPPRAAAAQAVGRQVLKALLAVAFIVAVIEAVRSGTLLWREGVAAMDWLDWVWVGLAPVLGWVWLRRFSVFAPGRGQCLLPPEGRERGK